MLQNAYFLAKIGSDTAENERHFPEILPIGRRVADRQPPSHAKQLNEEAAAQSRVQLELDASQKKACASNR